MGADRREGQRCQRKGCHLEARWRPMLYVPVLSRVVEVPPEPAGRVLVVALPIVVCDVHKLPRRSWAKSPRLVNAVEKLLAPSEVANFQRGWVAHVRLGEDVPL